VLSEAGEITVVVSPASLLWHSLGTAGRTKKRGERRKRRTSRGPLCMPYDVPAGRSTLAASAIPAPAGPRTSADPSPAVAGTLAGGRCLIRRAPPTFGPSNRTRKRPGCGAGPRTVYGRLP